MRGPPGSMSGCGWVSIPVRPRKTVTGLVGLDVHRAARVAAVAYGGQVLLSETAAALVRDCAPARHGAEGSGCPPAEGPGTPGADLPAHAAGLRAEFPPLRSLGNPALQNNLPAQLATFIGRGPGAVRGRGLWWSPAVWSP